MITTQVCNYITQGLVQGRKYILKSVAQLAHIFQVLVAPINNITSPIHVGEQYSCYVCLDLKLMHALNSLFTGKCSFTVLSFELVSIRLLRLILLARQTSKLLCLLTQEQNLLATVTWVFTYTVACHGKVHVHVCARLSKIDIKTIPAKPVLCRLETLQSISQQGL